MTTAGCQFTCAARISIQAGRFNTGCVLQAQEHLTALHSACQLLQSTANSKAADNKLQKALNKLYKLEQGAASQAASFASSSKAGSQAQATLPATAAAGSETRPTPRGFRDAASKDAEQSCSMDVDDAGTLSSSC